MSAPFYAESLINGNAFNENACSRRDWMRVAAAGVAGASMSGWLEELAADTATHQSRRRSVILLWMTG